MLCDELLARDTIEVPLEHDSRLSISYPVDTRHRDSEEKQSFLFLNVNSGKPLSRR